MAVTKQTQKSGAPTWLARWRDPSGVQRKRSFVRRVDAERHLLKVQTSLLDGNYIDAARSRITVEEWGARWLAGQVQLKTSTRVRYESLLRKHVLPTWGSVPLAKIAHADVATWVASMTVSGAAASSVRQAHRVFSLLLALAVRDGRLTRNPADGVRLPRAVKAEKRFLTHEQVLALADAAGRYRLVILTLAYCGLRYGELAALTVGRVDLMRRRLDVAASASEVAGRLVTGDPKTHQRRSVPIPRSLVDALAEQVAGKPADALVFAAPEGGPLRLMNFRRRVFDPAARSVGLDGLTPHELRHTAASLAVSAGANVKAVQRLLGHASAAMTLDVYSGLFDDDLDAVAERMDAAAALSAQAAAQPDVPFMCHPAPVASLDDRRATP